MTEERRERLIRAAKKLNPPDLLAIAVLEGGREFRPDPETPPILLTPWAGLRWTAGKAA